MEKSLYSLILSDDGVKRIAEIARSKTPIAPILSIKSLPTMFLCNP